MQSKEKVLAKMVREGLTEKVEADRIVKFKFENVGKLPPPVLQVRWGLLGLGGCCEGPCRALHARISEGRLLPPAALHVASRDVSAGIAASAGLAAVAR